MGSAQVDQLLAGQQVIVEAVFEDRAQVASVNDLAGKVGHDPSWCGDGQSFVQVPVDPQ